MPAALRCSAEPAEETTTASELSIRLSDAAMSSLSTVDSASTFFVETALSEFPHATKALDPNARLTVRATVAVTRRVIADTRTFTSVK